MISRWASCYNKWRSWCAMSITLTADGASRVSNNNSNIHAHTHTLRTSRGNVLQFYDRLLALGERASEFITQMTYCGALKVCALPVNVSRNCSQHPGPRRTTRSQAPLGNQNKTSYVHLTRFIKPSSSERSIPRTTDCVKERRRRADPKNIVAKIQQQRRSRCAA